MQQLPFETVTQVAALALTLVAGWFFGLASAPGGRRWRDRYQDMDLEMAGYRDQAETDLREANRRIRDLEAENARLRAGAPKPAPEPDRSEGHSTATVLGAAAAGAAVGAIAAKATDGHDDVPV